MAYDTSKLASLQALKDTATRIKKEYLAAISKAGHASFQKAESVPTAEEAQENILYFVKTPRPASTTSTLWWMAPWSGWTTPRLTSTAMSPTRS